MYIDMKRIFVIFLSVLILGSFSLSAQEEKPVIDCNYEMPTFSDNSALLIDARKVSDKFGNGSKVIGFNFKIVNYSKYKSVQFEVFVHSPLTQKWESLGKETLPGFDADATFGKKFPDLGMYRYYAVVTKEANKYDLKVDKGMAKIEILVYTKGADMTQPPLPYHDASNAYVFTSKKLPRGANENIRMLNNSSLQTLSIGIYGWDKKNYEWVKIASIAAQTGQKKPTVFEADNRKIHFSKFDYLSIVAHDGKKHDYIFREDHSDWSIDASDHLGD